MRKGSDSISEAHKFYEEVISMAPSVHDAYIELADSLIKSDPMKAVDTYSKYPFKELLTFDDAYIYGEMVRLLMKNQKYDDPRLGPSMISLGKVMGLTVLEKYVETLDKTFKYSKLLKQVYAGVHSKSVDDPDLQQFFKFKCWVWECDCQRRIPLGPLCHNIAPVENRILTVLQLYFESWA